MKYGERLKQARLAKGLTQDALAELSEVPQGTISKIERGDQDSSTYDTLLADALDVSGIWLTIEKGEMFNTGQTQGVNEERAQYSKDEDEIIDEIRHLSEADRARLPGILKALNQKLDKKTS